MGAIALVPAGGTKTSALETGNPDLIVAAKSAFGVVPGSPEFRKPDSETGAGLIRLRAIRRIGEISRELEKAE